MKKNKSSVDLSNFIELSTADDLHQQHSDAQPHPSPHELEEQLKKYIELYDFAPVGFLSLDCKGIISQANIKSANMLGLEQSLLLNRCLKDFLSIDHHLVFDAFLSNVFSKRHKGNCEVKVTKEGQPSLWVQIEAMPSIDGSTCNAVLVDVTQRKEAQEEIRYQKTLFHSLFDQSPYGVVILDVETMLPIEFNTVAHQQLGYTRAEFAGLRVGDYEALEQPEDTNRHKSKIVFDNWDDFETLHRTKQDELRAIHVFVRTIDLSQKKIFLCIFNDITEQKREAEKLRISENRLALALRSAGAGVWDWDIEHDQLVWDDQMYHLYGLHKEDFSGAYEAWLKGLHPEDVDKSNDISQRARLGEIEYDTEFRVVHPDGTIRHLKAFGQFERDAAGNALRMIGINYDVTDRIHMQQALQKSKNEYQLLIEHQTDLIIKTDLNGHFLYASPSYCEYFNKNQDELIGKIFYPTIHEDDRQMVEEIRATLLHPPHTCNYEERVLTKNGWCWIEWLYHPLLQENGEITELLGVGHDITQRKQVEADLIAANARLEALWSVTSLEEATVKVISDHILNTIARMTGSDYGFYGFINDDESVMTIHSWSGEAMKDCAMVRKPQHFLINEAGIWAEAVRRREPFILNNYSASHLAKKGLPEGHVALKNLLVVPHFSHGKISAIAAVANRTTDYDLDDVNQITTFLSSVHAIVDSKRAEEALKESEEKFRSICENSFDLIALLDLDGSYLYCNQSYTTTLGYDTTKMLGRSGFDFLHPENREEFIRFLQHSLSDRQFEDQFSGKPLLAKVLCHDGEYKWIEHRFRFLQDEHGKPIQILLNAQDITERKRTEEALQFQAQVLNQIYDRITVTDLQGNITYVNDAEYQMLGMPREQLIGQHISIYGEDPTRGATQAEIIRETLLKGEWRGEVVNYSADGKSIFLDCRTQVVKDSQGRPTGLCGISTDISEQKWAELSLKESEARFKAVSEYSHNAICLIDETGKIVWVNQAFVEMGGYSREQVYQAPSFTELLAPESVDFVVSNFLKFVMHQDYEHHYSFFFVRADGQKRLCEKHMTDYTDRFGKRILAISMLDITEQKRDEEALRESERRFRLALEGTNDAWWEWDLTTNQLFYSPKWWRMLGYVPDEIHSDAMLWQQWMHPEDLEHTLYMFNTALMNNMDTYEVEFKLLHKDGHYVPVLSRGYILRDENRKPVRIYGTNMDLTERKRIESMLVRSEKLASLGTVSAGIAHEINSPLQVISGISDSLLERIDQDNLEYEYLKEKLTTINRNSWRIADIVRSLLTYARATPEGMDDQDLNNIVKNTARLMEHTLKLWSNVTIEFDLSSEPPFIFCNRGQVGQVLINLLTNARDAMPQGGEITIRTGFATDDKRRVFLKVVDTGTGIPEEFRDKIFDPFYPTKPEGKGTGLGLSIIAGIVHAHGGEIKVESQLKHGTEFTVYFPQHPQSYPPSKNEA